MEAEDTLNAIRSGSVDALVVRTPRGEQLFTLKSADQTYRALVEAMSEGAVTVRDGIISYCNREFARMARTPMERVLGSSIFDLIESDSFRRLAGRLQRGMDTRGAAEGVLRMEGEEGLPVAISGSRFFADGKAALGLVVTDIAERKQAERSRRELAQSVLSAQEMERQRVARDLHDGVNQLLASVKYRLHGVTVRAKDSGNEPIVAEAMELVDRAIAEVLLISRNLRPSEMDDFGLRAALQTLMLQFQKRSGIAARLRKTRDSAPGRIPKAAEMALYRITQESLNNVEKHSGATRVEVALNISGSEASLTIHDNGRGFAKGRRGGLGLHNMTERAAMLGGSLTVWSMREIGTKISARIPTVKLPRKTGQSPEV
jgi:PAS domain S-box-containing protein